MNDATVDSLKTEFDLEPETDASAFLGIQIQHDAMSHMIALTQLKLVENILQA